MTPLLGRVSSAFTTRRYEEKRRILAGLSEAQRRWEARTGSRLVVSPTPPYFSYVRENEARGAA